MPTTKKELALLVVLLAVFLVQSLVTLNSKNLIFDEPATITVGYYFVKYLDTSIYIFHPPLSYILAGFPLLFLDINTPYSYQECKDIGYYKCSQDIMFKYNNAEKIGFYTKLPFLLISILLGVLLFLFAKELYGFNAGVFSLILYAFSPAILAYNTIAFTDLLVSCFIFGTVYFLWKLMRGYTQLRLLLTGIFFGLALASKFTALFLIPIIILAFSARIFKEKTRECFKKSIIQFFLILLIGFIAIYSTYFFSFDTIANSIPAKNLKFLDSLMDKNFPSLKFLIHNLKIPMPQYWVGLAGQSYIESSKSKTAYLNGEIYNDGKWHYFFEVLLIKTPIPLLIFFIISFFIKKIRIDEAFALLPMLIFLGIFVLSNFNIGLRHILPIMPFMFLFSSRILSIKFEKKLYKILFRVFIALMISWYVISAISIMPDYIAYFNEFVGIEDGHKYLLGSNIDLGQDLKGLKIYLKKNNIKNIKLSYHGSFDPLYYNISYEPLPMEYYIPWVAGDENYKEDCSKKYGVIAISVSNLHNLHLINKSCFDWIKEEPIARIGYSIYVYNILNK